MAMKNILAPLFFALLTACNFHTHLANKKNYTYPFGIWLSNSSYKFTIRKEAYDICFENQCQSGELIHNELNGVTFYYLLGFRELPFGKQLLIDAKSTGMGIHNLEGLGREEMEGAIEFYPNRGKPIEKKYCYGRPCFGVGTTYMNLYSFHWHGPLIIE